MFFDAFKDKDTLGIFLFILGIIYLLFVTYIGISMFSIWFDETFSMMLVTLPFSQAIEIALNDVHPPLYYIILKLFVKIFSSFIPLEIISRLVSTIPMYLIVILSYKKVRKMFDWLTAGLFTLCIITMPQLMLYSVEIRMYSWGLFFITASFIYAYDIYKNGFDLKNMGILTFLTICSAYTHYFSAIASFSIYLYLLIFLIRNRREYLKYFFTSTAISILAYVPWIFIVFNQYSLIQNRLWIDPISFKTIISYVYYVLSPANILVRGDEILSPTILGTIFLIIFIFLVFKVKDKYSINGILILVSVVLIGVLISITVKPFFHARYMIPSLGCFWLAFSILLSKIYDNKKLFIPILIFVLIIGAVGCVYFINIESQLASDTQKEFSEINDVIGSGNIVAVDNGNMYVELLGYYSKDNHYLCWIENFSQSLYQALDDPGIKGEIEAGSHVFYIDYDQENIDELQKYNLTLEFKGEYTDYSLGNNPFRIYEIIP